MNNSSRDNFSGLSNNQSITPRRDFLKLSSLGLLGAALPNYASSFFSPIPKYPAKLSVQLYTVRDQFLKDIPGTLKKIADIGFKYVETAFWPEGVSIEKASEYLNDAGLLVSSCHVELPIGDKKQVMLDTANAFGCSKMIWHGWPEDKRTKQASLWLFLSQHNLPNVFLIVWLLILLPRIPAFAAYNLICLLMVRICNGIIHVFLSGQPI